MLMYSCASEKDKCKNFEKQLQSFRNLSYSKTDSQSVIEKIQLISDLALEKKCVGAELDAIDFLIEFGLFEKAKLLSQNIVKRDSSNVLALCKLAKVYYNEDNYDSSIICFDLALEQKRRGDGYFDFGNLDLGKYNTERKQFDVNHVEIIFQRGLSLYRSGRLDQAIEAFDYSLQKFFNVSECHLYLGGIYIQKGERERGCSELRKSFEIKSDNSRTIDLINKYCN
jgi:tetratricopeptide (TPR) repeat protein